MTAEPPRLLGRGGGDRPLGDRLVDAQFVRGADGSPRWIVGVDEGTRLLSARPQLVRGGVFALRPRRAPRAGRGDARSTRSGVPARLHRGGRRPSSDPLRRPALATLLGGAAPAPASAQRSYVFDARMTARTFPPPSVMCAAVGPDGRLYAATRARCTRRTRKGTFRWSTTPGRDAARPGRIGEHVWSADGRRARRVDGQRVAETRGTHVPPDARLASSPSGDVWVMASGTSSALRARRARDGPGRHLVRHAGADLRPLLLVVPSPGRRVGDRPLHRRGLAVGTPRHPRPRRRQQDDAPEGHPLPEPTAPPSRRGPSILRQAPCLARPTSADGARARPLELGAPWVRPPLVAVRRRVAVRAMPSRAGS